MVHHILKMVYTDKCYNNAHKAMCSWRNPYQYTWNCTFFGTTNDVCSRFKASMRQSRVYRTRLRRRWFPPPIKDEMTIMSLWWRNHIYSSRLIVFMRGGTIAEKILLWNNSIITTTMAISSAKWSSAFKT